MIRHYIQRLALLHPATILVTAFFVGFIPFAPGTFGSLVAIPIALGMFASLGVYGYLGILITIVVLYFVGVVATNYYIAGGGNQDPKEVVIDEVVGQLIVILMTTPYLASLPMDNDKAGIFVYCASFLLFRFFDILKPWPIRWVDRNCKGGTGVMLDDVVAGIFASITFYIIVWFV